MNEPDTIRLDVPATYRYLNVVGACITEVLARVEGLAEPAMVAYRVNLAVHEICANIVEHAYAGQPEGRIAVTVVLITQPRSLIIDLHDTGRSFDPACVLAPNLNEGQVGGYGLFLVRELMDDVIYQPQPGSNCWRLVKGLEPGPPRT
jgi:serine/threonine-protein kinase RsbW